LKVQSVVTRSAVTRPRPRTRPANETKQADSRTGVKFSSIL